MVEAFAIAGYAMQWPALAKAVETEAMQEL